MYLITNAMKNLARNFGRNVLVAAVTLAVVISAVVTLTINNAAAKIIEDVRLDVGSRVEIKQDLITMLQSGLSASDRSFITIGDFIAYSESDYLRETIFNAEMLGWSDTFFAVGDDLLGTGTRTNDSGEEVLVETCKLIGSSDPGSMADFGVLREIMPGGRMFDAPNECIISEDIAAINGVTVGDSIHISGAYAHDKAFDLEVVGIYSDGTDEYTDFFLEMYGLFSYNRRNEVITSFETVMSAGWDTNAGLDMKTEYYLKDPDDLPKFDAEARAKGLPYTYDVSINQAAYDKVVGPLAGMKATSATFMAVSLALGAAVLALVSLLAIRERKYEVGVLRAMGLGKAKVAIGILAEAVIVAALCLAIGLAAGGAASQPVADGMMAGRLAEAEEADADKRNLFISAGGQTQVGDGSSGYAPVSDIQVELGAGTLRQIAAVTLALAALSGAVGVATMTKYEPLKILRERN